MEYLIVAAGYAFWIAVYLVIALPIRWYIKRAIGRRARRTTLPTHRGSPVH